MLFSRIAQSRLSLLYTKWTENVLSEIYASFSFSIHSKFISMLMAFDRAMSTKLVTGGMNKYIPKSKMIFFAVTLMTGEEKKYSFFQLTFFVREKFLSCNVYFERI